MIGQGLAKVYDEPDDLIAYSEQYVVVTGATTTSPRIADRFRDCPERRALRSVPEILLLRDR